MAALTFVFLTACGGNNGDKSKISNPTPTLTLSPTTAKIILGKSETFTVTATNTDFTVTGDGCAKTNSTTVVCTPTRVGTYDLTVTAAADTTLTRKAPITVVEVAIALTSDSNESEIKVGETRIFTVTATNTEYSMSVADEAGCVISGNNASEIICTPTAVMEYNLVVTAKADMTKTARATFSAYEVGISIAPSQAVIILGESETFTVTTKHTGFDIDVDPMAGCVRNDHEITCTPTLDGTYALAVTATADTTKTATSTLSADKGITSVTPQPDSTSVAREGTVQLVVDVVTFGGADQTVIWSIEGNQALNTTIDENGLLTVSAGESAENLTIRAVSTEDAMKFGEVAITVNNPLPMYTLKPITGGTVTVSSEDYYGYGVYAQYNPFANASENPVTVPSFQIGETEVPYELWYPVRIWAENHGYVFFRSRIGREGNNGTDGAEPTPNRKTEPVTAISSREMVVWINAYNEITGRAPAYYLRDTTPEQFTDTTKVVRISEAARDADDGEGQADRAVLNPNTNGFRFPMDEEWEYAAHGGDPTDVETWNYKWSGTNEDSILADYAVYGVTTTAPVKSKKPNTAGLYDMTGNVAEVCWGIYAPESDMPGGEIYRIGRGGSYRTSVDDANLTNTYRAALAPSNAEILNQNRGGGLGFRLAANAIPVSAEP